MRGVRRGDGHKVDAIGAIAFGFQHLAPVAIGPVRRQPQPSAIVPTRLGPVIQRPGDEIEQTIQPCAQPVGRADLAAFAATDKAPFQLCHLRPLT